MTITIYSQKGGVGKSTTCVTLARHWAHLNPLVLDLDPQSAVSRYLEGNESVTVVQARASGFYEGTLPDAALRLIDCPPDLSAAVPALEVADLVIIPFNAEYAATEQLLLTIREIQSMATPPDVRALLTRYVSSDSKQKTIKTKAYTALGITMFKTVIPQDRKISYTREYAQTILDYDFLSRGAGAYRKLAKEIEQTKHFQELI